MIPQYRAAVVSAVVGVAFVATAAFLGGSAAVQCDGHDMHDGDVCVVTQRDGSVRNESYDDMLSQQRRYGLVGGALGLFCLGVAGWQVAQGGRRRREQAAAAQATLEILAIPLPYPGPSQPPYPGPPQPAAAPQQPVPADVAQAAHAAALGGHVRSLPPGNRSRALVTWGCLLAAAVIFTIAAMEGGRPTMEMIAVVITLLLATPFAITLFKSPLLSSKARRLGIHVFADGFVRATSDGVQAYRWDRIATLYQSIVRVRVNGISTGTQYHFYIGCTDGRSLTLTNDAADMSVLGPILQEQVARVQVPRALQYLHSGRPIPFGAYTVTSGGVSNGGRTAAWGEIAGVRIHNGALRLSRAGGGSILGGRKIHDVPNFATFVTLVNTLAGSRVAV